MMRMMVGGDGDDGSDYDADLMIMGGDDDDVGDRKV